MYSIFNYWCFFSFYFSFLFFPSEQLYYRNRRYRKNDTLILCRSQCFANLCTPTSGSNITPFIPLGLSARECAQAAHITRNETYILLHIQTFSEETLHQVASNMRKTVNAFNAGHCGLFQHLTENSLIVLSFVNMKHKQQESTGQELYLPCHVCVHDLYKKYSCVRRYYCKEKCGTVHQTAMHTWGGTCFDILHSCTAHMHHTDSHKIYIPANKNHNISSPT